MELKDIKSMDFKEIEKKFNEALSALTVTDSSQQSYVKEQIFEHLKKTFHKLEIRELDYNYNRFAIEIEYENDFNGIASYDKGTIKIGFSIKTKRTDKLEKITKTKSKYIHTKHIKPISFAYYRVSSYVPSYDWNDHESNEDLKITGGKWSHSNGHTDDIEGKNVNELLSEIAKTYTKQFRSDIVQPYLKQLFVFGRRRQVIYDSLSKELQETIDKRDDQIFEKLADFIIEKNLIV